MTYDPAAYQRQKEHRCEYQRERYRTNEQFREAVKARSIRVNQTQALYLKRYGLTLADYERMFAEQGGRCAICATEVSGARLCVDHDHGTGKVRGLLCHACNKAIGGFRDSTELLKRAIAYLLKE
jgi:hypothetical protein